MEPRLNRAAVALKQARKPADIPSTYGASPPMDSGSTIDLKSMIALLPMKRLARFAGVAAVLLLGLLQPGSLPAKASQALPDEGPSPTRVPDTGRTLVLLGIGVVAASWAHRKSSTAPHDASRKR